MTYYNDVPHRVEYRGQVVYMRDKLIDLLMLLSCITIVALAFASLLHWTDTGAEPPLVAETLEPAGPEDETAPVLMAARETPVATPEPTAGPDKPAYDPAIPLSEDLQCILRAACEENGIELSLALGLIETESNFRPDADNGLCYGLCQLNRRYFPDDLPAGENICAGMEYLGQLLAQYGDEVAALTAYNAGSYDGVVSKYASAVMSKASRWAVLQSEKGEAADRCGDHPSAARQTQCAYHENDTSIAQQGPFGKGVFP